MPAQAAPVADERSALLAYLAQQHDAFRCAVFGLADDQAGTRSTVSELTVGTLVKHVTGVQRSWLDIVLAAPGTVEGSPDAYEDHARGFVWESADTVASVLAAYDDKALRTFLARLEDGGLLRAYGLENLLEGDFFGWYATPGQWTPALAGAVRAVIQRLADYEGRAPRLLPGNLGDMFRQLYQRTIPAVIRHDLGEYYTPRWLAQAVLADLPAPPGWRGLDPCCGSGTFVVEMIAEVMAETEHLAAPARLAARSNMTADTIVRNTVKAISMKASAEPNGQFIAAEICW